MISVGDTVKHEITGRVIGVWFDASGAAMVNIELPTGGLRCLPEAELITVAEAVYSAGRSLTRSTSGLDPEPTSAG